MYLNSASRVASVGCFPERAPFSVEELCAELARAIEAGDAQAAVRHATSLAHQQMALTIQPAREDSEDGEIR